MVVDKMAIHKIAWAGDIVREYNNLPKPQDEVPKVRGSHNDVISEET